LILIVSFLPTAMPRRSKRRVKRQSRPGNGGGTGLQSRVINFSSRELPFRITQATTGTGGLTSVSSQTSSTAATSVFLDPYSIGGRLFTAAGLYSKYRFRRVVIRYVPDTTFSGVQESVAGATTTPSYGDRVFAWGFNRDPAYSTLSYSQLVQMGGRIGNTSRSSTLSFVNKDPQWYFTSATAGSPSTIDLRLTAPLQLRFAYFNTSTTAAASYGHLVFDIDVQFMGDGPIAVPLSLGSALAAQVSAVESKAPADDVISDIEDLASECSVHRCPRLPGSTCELSECSATGSSKRDVMESKTPSKTDARWFARK
jgi:hypothetical protein